MSDNVNACRCKLADFRYCPSNLLEYCRWCLVVYSGEARNQASLTLPIRAEPHERQRRLFQASGPSVICNLKEVDPSFLHDDPGLFFDM